MRARIAAGLWIPLLVGATACTPPRPTWVRPDGKAQGTPLPPPPPPGGAAPIPLEAGGGDARRTGNVHVVREGETLWRIAHDTGVDPDELADLNAITDPTRLPVGRELLLPGPPGRRVAQAAPPERPPPLPPRKKEPGPKLGSRPPDDDDGPRARLRWPVKGVLYSRFGAREDGRHDGIDIAAPEGTNVVAAAAGRVIYAGSQRGYGNIVILQHPGGLITLYAHNRENLVKEGEAVDAGDRIAVVGRTGRATGPHCHFEVRLGTAPRDPLRWLPP